MSWIMRTWRWVMGDDDAAPADDAPGLADLPVYGRAGRYWLTRLGRWWHVMEDTPGGPGPVDRFALRSSAVDRMAELAGAEEAG
jgi:hypothetical protein